MALADDFRLALIAILGVSIVFNMLFVAFTVRRKIGTRLCTVLLRCQAIIDLLLMTANMLVMQFRTYVPAPSQSASDAAWLIYCKLYPSQVLYWSLVCMSVYNILCISVERCICLCCPFWYMLNNRKLLSILAVIIAVSPFFVEAPYCLMARNVVYRDVGNDTIWKFCLYTYYDAEGEKIIGIVYVTLFWIVPFCIIVLLYVCIICRIRRSANMREASAGGSTGAVSAAAKKLTLTTGVTAAAFVLLFAMDSITFLLSNLEIRINLSPFFDQLDSFLVSMNSAVNPLIYLIFMPEFRRFLLCRSHPADGRTGKKTTASGTEMTQMSTG